MFDEGNCISLPNEARLKELGMNPAMPEPWAIVEIDARPHKQDKQRIRAASLQALAEEWSASRALQTRPSRA